MTENTYDFPDRRIIEEEAGERLIRLDGDTQLTDDQINSLREWLDRSPLHREELSNLLSFYNKMNMLTELSVPLGRLPVDKVKPSTTLPRRLNTPVIFFNRKVIGFSIAAVIIGLVIILLPSIQHDPDLSHCTQQQLENRRP